VAGLRTIAASEYEFLSPTFGYAGYDAWHKLSAANLGVPGLDPYPLVNERRELQLVAGERIVQQWMASSLYWLSPLRLPTSRLPASGQFARSGKLPLVLTTQRVAVVAPEEYLNYEGRPNAKATIAPTAMDSFKLRAVRKIGSAVAPKLTKELLGDDIPRGGHVPLDCIESLAIADDGRQLTIGVQIANGDAPASAQVRVGLSDGSGAEVVAAIVRQVGERWAEVGVPERLAGHVPVLRPTADSDGRVEAGFFRPIGAATLARRDAVEPVAAPALLTPG
jgi:hypothetical protein